MVGRRKHGEDADAVSSPWATDEIVAGPAPEFAWEQPNADADEEPSDPRDRDRRSHMVVAVGCVVALILGTVALWPRHDDPTGTTESRGGPETTLGTLPGADEERSDEERAGAESAADGTTEEAGDDLLANAPAGAVGEATSIELPDAVAAIDEPTEIVLITNGEIITVSLPSGSVRRVQASGSFDGGNVVVAPDAVAWFAGPNLNIVPRIGPALTVDLDAGVTGGGYLSDWMTDDAGSTRFLVETFSLDENGRFTVSTDGTVAAYEPDPSRTDVFDFYSGLRSEDGSQILNDAGGVYLIGPDDVVERLSTGRALAANAGFVLLRECDETHDCSYSVLDRSTRDQRPIPATTEQLGMSYGFDLAPDGTAVLTTDFDGQQRRLVDLVDGTTVAEFALSDGLDRNTQWAADSSGVFEADPRGEGLNFIDRASGESVEFAMELGRVGALGVRMPDAELALDETVVATRSVTFSDRPAGPIGLDVVVLGELGSMAHIDLDGASASVWAVPTTPGSNAPDLISVGADVVVLPSGGTRAFVSTLGQTQPLDPMGGAGLPGYPRFPGSVPSIVWSPRDDSASGVDHRVVEIHRGAETTNFGAGVRLANSELLGEDGTGRLVARVGGDIFVVGVNGTSRLTDGDLLALGPNHALVRTCDDSLRCSVDRIERTTGEASAPDGQSAEVTDLLAVARSVDDPSRSPRLSGTISPDGEAALMRSGPPGTATQWALADFASGGRFDIATPTNGQPIIWNSDSSVAVYLSDGVVHIIERSVGRTSTLEGLGKVRSITDVDPAFSE